MLLNYVWRYVILQIKKNLDQRRRLCRFLQKIKALVRFFLSINRLKGICVCVILCMEYTDHIYDIIGRYR